MSKRCKWMLVLLCMTVWLSGCGQETSRKEKKSEDGRTVITLANYNENQWSYYVDDAISKFNQTNTEYCIEVVDYSGDQNMVSTFNKDITAGKYPDILLVEHRYLDNVMHSGLLEDLNPYLEQDAELHPEDFLDNILDACREDGHLYYLGNDCSVFTLFGKKKALSKYENGWTMEEMLTFAKESDVPLFYVNDKFSVFNEFVGNGVTDFVDWNQRKGLFRTDLFQEVIMYCNQMPKTTNRTWIDPEAVSDFLQDKCRLSMVSLMSFMDIEDATRFYGPDLTFVGQPAENPQISTLRFNMNIGICTKSPYKEQAWEFIKLFYTKEAQREQSPTISVRKDVFAMQKKAAVATEPYVDEMGEMWEPIDCEAPGFTYTPLTQEEADLVERLVTSAGHCWKDDIEIENIVNEEVQSYFNGDCTAERVGVTIDSRVETYLNEQQ